MIVRKATAEEMLKLWGYHEISKASPTARLFYQNIASKNAIFWVVDCDGKLIGELYVFLNIDDKAFADGISKAYLCAFRIKPEYRGRGFGSQMLNAALTDLKSIGFQSATIGVGFDEERNVRLYRRLGFTTMVKDCFIDPCNLDENMQPKADSGFWLLSKTL